jgi:fatty acid-binding protein DegV
MSSYVIVTESSTDLTVAETEALGVTMLDLSVIVEGEEPRNNRDVDVKEFYELLRSKKNVTTSAINPEGFAKEFERILAEGKDILYLGFSSGLSSTFSAGKIAAEELAEK